MRSLHSSRALGGALALLCLLASRADATWSVVAVNSRTREVVVAGATCLANNQLQRTIGLVRVGHGGAASQSFVHPLAANRIRIWDGFSAGDTPTEILAVIAAADSGFQSRQFGIVDAWNDPVAFTGTGAGDGKLDVVGVDGDIRYAIQGNVLTGAQVVLEAELAFLLEPGDMTQKVMAAMRQARDLGGDGRCSCSQSAPDSCGVPPSRPFDKSAHSAFLVISRVGDTDGVCTSIAGCANGDYVFDTVIPGSVSNPNDPVNALQVRYDAWRAGRIGLPDHFATSVSPDRRHLTAGTGQKSVVTVTLRDVDGARITNGGHGLSFESVLQAPPVTTPGNVVDHGDGTYTFEIAAGRRAGVDAWRVIVDDGVRPVHVQPAVEVFVAGRGR